MCVLRAVEREHPAALYIAVGPVSCTLFGAPMWVRPPHRARIPQLPSMDIGASSVHDTPAPRPLDDNGDVPTQDARTCVKVLNGRAIALKCK